jgi:hypothetical protein
MSMFTEIEGKCISFSGDNVWPPDFTPNIIYRNRVGRKSHQITAKLYRRLSPEVLCTGHGLFTDVRPEVYETFYENAKRLTKHFEMLLPAGSGAIGIEPAWIRIVPYQIPVRSGDTATVAVNIHNPLDKQASIRYRWMLPSGWTAKPAEQEITLSADETSNQKIAITVPDSFKINFPKQAITLDVTLDDNYLGQIAEAVAEFTPFGPAGAVHPPRLNKNCPEPPSYR